jgi:hypothetical protein
MDKRPSYRLIPIVLLISGLLGLFALSACDASSLAIPSSSDLLVIGPPSLTAVFINQVLADHNSPAAGLGQTFYDYGVQYNIDPAFALAVFQHESNFGELGEATASLSIGNVRCLEAYPCQDGFAFFPSWGESIKSWYRLISGSLYVGSGLTTVAAIIHRYAPSSDGGSSYIDAVTQSVTSWRQGQDPH